MPNRLAQQTSLYLRQHADNPVDWHPWGPEAFEKARQEDKPIFLSVGYSSCHWCHVMERESFSDPETARLLNQHFVPIKVDREERPDVDQLYMRALQTYQHLAGQPVGGGWPLSMFLTPQGEPILGGTYWPPEPRYGMPSFRQVLEQVARLWRENRQALLNQARQITQLLRHQTQWSLSPAENSSAQLDDLLRAAEAMHRAWDPHWGGFGHGPKFPHPLELRFLLRLWHRTGQSRWLQMITLTLDRMAAGGIYDHLGGGFHRYAVDGRWLVPHFEKMLYDNAMLATLYLEAYQATGEEQYATVARETLDYLLREMQLPEGGFASAQDADSPGGEGAYYVWTPQEVEAVLEPQLAQWFCYVYDITPQGNFEGRTVLHRPKGWQEAAAVLGMEPRELQRKMAAARRKLLLARAQRPAPQRDDKVILSWNALVVEAMCSGWVVLGQKRYYQAACQVAEFVQQHMTLGPGSLAHSWAGGEPGPPAFLDDVATWANALLALHQVDWHPRWVDEALELAQVLLEHFYDAPQGGFFYVDRRRQELLADPKDLTDNPTPSGNAMAAWVLWHLGQISGQEKFLRVAEELALGSAPLAARGGLGYGQLLLVLDLILGPSYQLVLVDSLQHPIRPKLREKLARCFLPRVFLSGSAAPEKLTGSVLEELFQGKKAQGGQPTLFVCRGTQCEAPVVGQEAIFSRIEQLSHPLKA